MIYFFFGKAEVESVKSLMTAVNHFADCTGLEVNPAKTEMLIVGTKQETMQRLLQITGFKKSEFPFRYLGVPVKPQRLTRSECYILVDRMVARVRAWPAKRLTYAGRLQLVN